MAEEQTDISILQNIRNEIEKRIDVLTDDVKTLRNISEEKQQDLKQQISSVYQIIEEKLSQIQSIDLNLKDSNQNINDLNARTSSMSDNISSLLQSQNEIKRNIQSLSVDINKIQNDSVNQFNQLNEYTREISKKIAESAKRQERQTREEMVRGPRAAAQASLGITPSAEAKSLQQPEPTQEPESEEKKPRTWAKWFEENAGLLGAAAGAATGVGAGALVGSGPKSAPSGPGYSSSPGEVPSDGMSQTLAAQRAARGANNLSDAQKRHMYALAVAEMGPPEVLRKKGIDPKEAYAAFMETPYNRGMTEGRENTNIGINLLKDYYQPLRPGEGKWYNKAYGQLGNTDSKLYNLLDSAHKEVAAGSNYSELGTQNSSAGVADDARVTQSVTTEKYGELITRKDKEEYAEDVGRYEGHGIGTIRNTKKWLERTQRQAREIDEKSRTQTPSQPSSQAAPQPDASRVQPQSQQSQQPDARRESVSEFMKSIRVPERIGYTFRGRTAASGSGMQSRPTNLSEEYVKNKFLAEAGAMMQLGIWPGGENPYFSEADKGKLRFDPTGGIKIDPVHRGRTHYGEHGQLAFDIGIGRLSKQLNISRREAHGIVQDLGSVLRQRVGGRASGSSLIERGQLGHKAHFHYAPQNAALQSAIPEILSNPEKFGRAGQRLIKRLERAGSLKYNQSTGSYELNREKFGKDFLDVYDKFSKAYFDREGPPEQQEQQEQPEQQEQQEQTQQQLFAGDTSESVIAKEIEIEKEKVRREGLTDKQRRMEDIKEGRFNFATDRRPDQQQGDESKRRNYYNVKELNEGRSQLTPEQQKKFDGMRLRGFQYRQSAYLNSILGPNWLKKSQQPDQQPDQPPDQPPDDSGSVLDYLPDIPAPTDLLPDVSDVFNSALKSVGRILFSSAEAAELKKPVDKSKIDMSDMPGSLDDGGEEGPRTDNRWNPLSPVTYGKSEEKIREMIELAKKAAEAAETAAKTSTENSGSGKGSTASGENKPQPPPARQSPTHPGGNQNGNNTPPKGSTGNGLDSRPRPSSSDYHPPAMNEAP